MRGSEQYRSKVQIKRIYIRIKVQLPLLLPTWQSSQPFLSYCSHHQRQTFIHHGALLLRSLITTSVQMRSVCGSVKIACSRVNGKEVFCLQICHICIHIWKLTGSYNALEEWTQALIAGTWERIPDQCSLLKWIFKNISKDKKKKSYVIFLLLWQSGVRRVY